MIKRTFSIRSHLGSVDIEYETFEPITVPFRPPPPLWKMQAAAAGWRPPDPEPQFEIDYSPHIILRTA